MIKIKSILKLSLPLIMGGLFFASCEDDDVGVLRTDVPVTSKINGPGSVEISSTNVIYQVSQRKGSKYTWTVEKANKAKESTSGTISLNFTDYVLNADSTVKITVVETDSEGVKGKPVEKTVRVMVSRPEAEIFPASGKPLKKDSSDYIILAFDKELKSLPTLDVRPVKGLTEKGTLEALVAVDIENPEFPVPGLAAENFWKGIQQKKSGGAVIGSVYYAKFTAGGGNAQAAELDVKGAVAADKLGGLTMKDDVSKINEIDNLAKGADFAYSSTLVKDGDDNVTVTVTFREALAPTTKPGDVKISFAGGGGIPAILDTAMTTLLDEKGKIVDNKVWTYTFKPGVGDGDVAFVVQGVTDVAGNEFLLNNNKLTVDNTAPVLSGASATEVSGQQYASITATSNESGKVFYLIVKAGSGAPSQTDVKTGNPFVSEAAGSGNISGPTTLTSSVLEVGNYEVYFVLEDEIKNLSEVSAPLALNIAG